MTSSSSPSTPPGRAALVTLLWLLLAGVVAGAVWALVWTPPVYTVADGEAALDEVALAQSFTSDAWYLVVAGPVGLVVGLVRRRTSGASGLLDLAAAVVGSVVAAYVMLLVGGLLGPGLPSREAVEALPEGATVEAQLTLASAFASQGWASYVYVVMIAWPLGVLAGWSAELVFPSLEPRDVKQTREADERQQAVHAGDDGTDPTRTTGATVPTTSRETPHPPG